MKKADCAWQVWGDAEKSAERWPLAMHEEFPALKLHNTFHSQWVTLIRAHVHIVVDDTFLEDLYQRHCFIGAERCVHILPRGSLLRKSPPLPHNNVPQNLLALVQLLVRFSVL